jgi:hypothetical protein
MPILNVPASHQGALNVINAKINGNQPPERFSIGNKAVSPQTNVATKPNTLPANQVAPKDLSATYANVGGTIYNKSAQAKFSNPADFFKDSGVTSFENLKFDNAYKPTGKETIYGQTLPSTNTPPPIIDLAKTLEGNLGGGYTDPRNIPSVPYTGAEGITGLGRTPESGWQGGIPPASAPYTPPNQGTTGVSQGGIIGNLLGIAQNETPEVTNARKNLQTLNENYGTQTANLSGSPIDLSLATGQQGILNRLFATKEAAAQTALSSALTSQGQQIGATTSAGNLNAPITGVQPGTQNISPSQPIQGMNVGQGGTATTSGAQNLNNLIGTRLGADGKTTEYFDKSTGKGFPTPQALADFVNKQTGGNTATAQNVFKLLEQQGQSGTNTSNNNALNPLANVQSIAQQVISRQISPAQAYAMGGNISNWQGYLNAELQRQQPGFDTSAAQAQYDSNQQTQTQQGNLKAQYQSAQQQGQNLTKQFSDLLTTYGLNPNELNLSNSVMQIIARNTSDPRYQALANYANDIANTYAQILSGGGDTTDLVRTISSNFINQTASGQSIKQSLAALDAQASAKIAGTQTPSTTGTNSTSSNLQGLF